jgi:hypothetical protein
LLGLNEGSTMVDEKEELDLPNIEDYSPELKRQRMRGQVEDEIKRVRELSAEDMLMFFCYIPINVFQAEKSSCRARPISSKVKVSSNVGICSFLIYKL